MIISSQKEANTNHNEADTCHMTDIDQNEAELSHMTRKHQRKVDRSLTVTDIQGEDVSLVGDDTDSTSSDDANDDDEVDLYDINDNKEILACLKNDFLGGIHHKLPDITSTGNAM